MGLIVAYSSHELTFIIAFIFVVFLLLAALLYSFVRYRRKPHRTTT